MDKSMICWDDVVFEYRNKNYGAYFLRNRYPYYLTLSAWIVMTLFVIGMVAPLVLRDKKDMGLETKVRKIDYTELKEAPPIDRIEVPKPAVQKYVAPKITTEEVKPDEMMPTQTEASALISTEVVEKPIEAAPEVVEVVEPPPPVVVEKPPEPVPDVIINPEFPGGMKECSKWLSKHLEYPAMAQRMGIEGRVVVEFTVDTSGKISDAKVVESLHKLCDQEALRLVKSMPAWTPGEKNGVKTTATYTLPIRFVLQ
jgi:periplasmic protein TonB